MLVTIALIIGILVGAVTAVVAVSSYERCVASVASRG